jgi:hypothetical protein
MSIFDLFSKKTEPEHAKTDFASFSDSLGNFEVFYPKHWKYDENTAVVDSCYAINFVSDKTKTSMRIEVDMKLPVGFDKKKFMKYAKDEIEKPTAGVLSKAYAKTLGIYDCVETAYEFKEGNTIMHGEKTIIFASNKVYSIMFICPMSEYDRLKNTFKYVLDSFVAK